MSMETKDLIAILAQAEPQKKPVSFGSSLIALGVLSLGITYTILGQLRPEFTTLSFPTGFFLKTLFLSVLAFSGFVFLKQAAKPVLAFPPLLILWIAPVFLLCLAAIEWFQAESMQSILNLALLPNFRACLFFVTTYGAAGIVALTYLMRQYAPADEKKAATMIGFAGAGAAAIGYSFHCPIDSPSFIAVAYGTPVLLLSAAANLIVPKFIRW